MATSLLARYRAPLLRSGVVALAVQTAADRRGRAPASTTRQRAIGAALAVELASLGYAADDELLRAFGLLTLSQQTETHSWLMTSLRAAKGADKLHVPLFKGFPRDVPEHADHLLRRIVSWAQDYDPSVATWIFGAAAATLGPDVQGQAMTLECGCTINPAVFEIGKFGACPVCERQSVLTHSLDESAAMPLKHEGQLRALRLGSDKDMKLLMRHWATSPVPLPPDEVQEMTAYLAKAPTRDVDALLALENLFPAREVKAHALAALLRRDPVRFGPAIVAQVSVMTDVLRLATAYSTGDASLVEAPRLKLPQGARRVLVQAMNAVVAKNVDYAREDLLRHPRRWVALFHAVHIGARTDASLELKQAAADLRSASGLRSYAAEVEGALDEVRQVSGTDKGLERLLNLLAGRPGEFARRLDCVVRASCNKQAVLDRFATVAPRVSTPVLLSLVSHARVRASENGVGSGSRLFVPKGSVARLHQVADLRAPVAPVHALQMGEIATRALHDRFAALPALGKVYIDPVLAGVPVPAGLANASTGLDTLTRGTRQELDPKTSIVRLFAYWKESAASDRVDLDLSLTMYDATWMPNGHIGFTNLRGSGFTHSGDVQSAPMGATEYIDIDLAPAKATGARYVAAHVITYTGQKFADFEVQMGLQARQNDTGKQFEARTVEARADLTAPATQQVGLALDLHTLQWVWLDLTAKRASMMGAVVDQEETLARLCQDAFSWAERRPTMYDLLQIHASARGEQVEEAQDADVRLGKELIRVTPATIAEWMAHEAPKPAPKKKATP